MSLVAVYGRDFDSLSLRFVVGIEKDIDQGAI